MDLRSGARRFRRRLPSLSRLLEPHKVIGLASVLVERPDQRRCRYLKVATNVPVDWSGAHLGPSIMDTCRVPPTRATTNDTRAPRGERAGGRIGGPTGCTTISSGNQSTIDRKYGTQTDTI
jgi:hypothetical protein